MKTKYIEVQQPIGTFYMCCLPAQSLLNIVRVTPRNQNIEGVQREMSQSRIKEIGSYCSEPDAVFPTPIVISIDKGASVEIDEDHQEIMLPDDVIVGEVIDGQHRLWGIQRSSYIDQFNLPVVFMFDMTVEEKAYVFSTINSNQKKVNSSLIYDLFDVSTLRSPKRTVHYISRLMNSLEDSPFYNRLKMLGKKEKTQENATLSQGTFAKSILMLISQNPDNDARLIKNGETLPSDSNLCFRQYFIEDRDGVILKILLNCFNALKEVFMEEWENPNDNILWKTTGFRAVIYALPHLYKKGIKEKSLTKEFFKSCFENLKRQLSDKNIKLTSSSFPGGGEQNQKKLAGIIVESIS